MAVMKSIMLGTSTVGEIMVAGLLGWSPQFSRLWPASSQQRFYATWCTAANERRGRPYPGEFRRCSFRERLVLPWYFGGSSAMAIRAIEIRRPGALQ